MKPGLDASVVIVTGAARGIGATIARLLDRLAVFHLSNTPVPMSGAIIDFEQKVAGAL